MRKKCLRYIINDISTIEMLKLSSVTFLVRCGLHIDNFNFFLHQNSFIGRFYIKMYFFCPMMDTKQIQKLIKRGGCFIG